ncbi:MAG: hypothetical protein PUC06_05905 [Oscillospiraceae bacterium]|nr:hypothetical protein [Oscillospiraceae bacterium]
MEENNNFTPETPKKKKGNTVTSIITVVLFVIAYRLFGIIETLIGLAAGFGLRALLKKSNPDKKWVDVVSIVVGILIAFVLAVIIGIFMVDI